MTAKMGREGEMQSYARNHLLQGALLVLVVVTRSPYVSVVFALRLLPCIRGWLVVQPLSGWTLAGLHRVAHFDTMNFDCFFSKAFDRTRW